MLISAELKKYITWFIYFLVLPYTTFTLMQTFTDPWWIHKIFKNFPDSVRSCMLYFVLDLDQSSMKTKQNESVIHNGNFLGGIHIKLEMFYTLSNVNSFCYFFGDRVLLNLLTTDPPTTSKPTTHPSTHRPTNQRPTNPPTQESPTQRENNI